MKPDSQPYSAFTGDQNSLPPPPYTSPHNKYADYQGYQPYSSQPHFTPQPAYSQLSEGNQPLVAPTGDKFTTSEYRDVFWAVLFILHGIVIVYCAIFYTISESKPFHESETSDTSILYHYPILLIVLIATGLLSSIFILSIIRAYATCLIWFTILFSCAMNLLIAFLCVFIGSVPVAVIFFIIFLISVIWVYYVRGRIAFAAVMLEVVVSVIQDFPGTILSGFFGIILQLMWVAVWSLAFSMSFYKLYTDKVDKDAQNFVIFLFLISFFWGTQVVKYVVHVTVSGTVATWYFYSPVDTPKNPTWSSLWRAMTTSFGSICLGAFMIAVVKALRVMVQMAKNRRDGLGVIIVECLVRCLERMVEYFNHYAFTFVAIYGRGYIDSAKDTWRLLKSRGFDLVINDQLISGVLLLCALIGGLLSAIVVLIYGGWVIDQRYWVAYAALAFFVGTVLTACAVEVIDSGVATLFVCLATDPAGLAMSHPDIYTTLNEAWQQRYPEHPLHF